MSSSRKVSRVGLEFIKGYEGFRAHASRLPDGRWTIGHGHVSADHPGGEIDRDEAERLLRLDLEPIERLLEELVETPLTQSQFDALASLAFNIGRRHFLLSGLVRHINDDRLADAAALFDVWRRARIDGRLVVVEELVRRRAAERALFLSSAEGPTPAPRAEVVPVADPDAIAGVPKQTPIRVRIDFKDPVAVTTAMPSNSARDTGLAADRAVERMRKAWPQTAVERATKDRLDDEVMAPVASAAERAVQRLRAAVPSNSARRVVRPSFTPSITRRPSPTVIPFVSGANALAIEPIESVHNEPNVAPTPQPVLVTAVDVERLEGQDVSEQPGECEEHVIDHPDGHQMTRDTLTREPGCDVDVEPEREPIGLPRSVAEAVARLHRIVPELAEGDGEAIAPPPFDDVVDDDTAFVERADEAPQSDGVIWDEPERPQRDDPVVERLTKARDAQPDVDVDDEIWRQVVASARARKEVRGSGGGAAMLGIVGAIMAAGGAFELGQFSVTAPSSAESAVWMTFAATGAMALASSVFLLARRWFGEKA